MNVNHKIKSIVFVSAVCPPDNYPNSTDIMTNNLIIGLYKCGYEITLLVVYKQKDNIEKIKNYYSKYVNKVLFLKSYFYNKMQPITYLYLLIKNSYNLSKYRTEIKRLKFRSIDLIIVNKVYFDEISYGRVLKKRFPDVCLFQYWSDPMAISGILPERLKYNIKRWPIWLLEASAIAYADKIIYGTEPLYFFQKKIFHKHAWKMRYIDVSYTIDTQEETNFVYKTKKYKMLYAGNYYNTIRNIYPLIEAVNDMPKIDLDVYGNGDCKIPHNLNVHLHNRVTIEELHSFEKLYNISICILNHSCIQIPGKIYYGMNKSNKIIIISDGKYSRLLINYLRKFKRFIICENNKLSIINAINHSLHYSTDILYVEKYFSPQKIANDLVNGGFLN